MTEASRHNLFTEIFCNYGNTAYLLKTHDNSFQNVRGKKLWTLWYGKHDKYGEYIDGLYVSNLEDKYKKATREHTLSDFDSQLICLYNSLQEEFDNLM